MKKLHCPLCGEKAYSHYEKLVELTYKSKIISFKQPGYWCSACDDGVIGPKDHKSTQKQLQTFMSSVDGLLIPDEVKRIRKKLNLTQRRASQIFGGGVNAFSRYEKGEIPVYRSTSQLLKLLDHHPEQLNELMSDTDQMILNSV